MIISLIKKLFKINDCDYRAYSATLWGRLDKALQKISYQDAQIKGLEKTIIKLKDKLNFEEQYGLDQFLKVSRYQSAFKNFVKFHKKKNTSYFLNDTLKAAFDNLQKELIAEKETKNEYLVKLMRLHYELNALNNRLRENSTNCEIIVNQYKSQLKKSNRTKNQLRKKIAELERKV